MEEDVVEEIVRVSQERMNLIRKRYKERFEQATHTQLSFGKGSVVIRGKSQDVFFALPVLKAIARGFSLDTALLLLKEDYELRLIDLHNFCNTENCVVRLRGRVIGKEGRAKTKIERATDSHISVYGHTVAIIAPLYSMEKASEAVNMLLEGARHSSVENYLSKAREELFYTKLKGSKHH